MNLTGAFNMTHCYLLLLSAVKQDWLPKFYVCCVDIYNSIFMTNIVTSNEIIAVTHRKKTFKIKLLKKNFC